MLVNPPSQTGRGWFVSLALEAVVIFMSRNRRGDRCNKTKPECVAVNISWWHVLFDAKEEEEQEGPFFGMW